MMKSPKVIIISMLTITQIANSGQSIAGIREVVARIPPSPYVSVDNPNCGVRGPLFQLSTPGVTAVVAAVSAKAGAAVLVVGKVIDISEKSPGILAEHINRMTGSNWSSCADMCVQTPSGAELKKIWWSDRDGIYGPLALPGAKAGIANRSTKDFSGWRNLIAVNMNGRWVVCGTGTNWSHNKIATKRIKIEY